MKVIMPKDVRLKLKDLTEKELTILFIEAAPKMIEAISMLLEKAFHKATVKVVTEEEFRSIETLIEVGQYPIILIGGSLTLWGDEHSTHKIQLSKLIPVIKEKSPETIIGYISIDGAMIDLMVRKGADFGILKHHFNELEQFIHSEE